MAANHGERTLASLTTAFEEHLRRVHGATEETLLGYSRDVRQFLLSVFGDGPVDVARIGAPDVVGFVSAAAARLRPSSTRSVAGSIRSFFRFLRLQGLCDSTVEAAIPAAPRQQFDAALPRHLSEEQLRRLLASLDGATPLRRRDRAVVLCLAQLGLRAGEVSALRLEDIDWREGTIHVRTRKSRHGAVLPLPHAAGRAIAAYLRSGRPKTQERRLFVLHRTAVGAPMGRSSVGGAVRMALRRAGIESSPQGAHLLRHTLATHMVCRGSSLKEIADVLGHRDLRTTAIYAKVDLPALREVAMPWPQVAS
jgi:integrase/recombinase XerD